MRKVILKEEEKTIDVDALMVKLIEGEDLTVGYYSRSNKPYFCYLNHDGRVACFIRFAGIELFRTYISESLKETILLAIKGGKKIVVFTRGELKELYKF